MAIDYLLVIGNCFPESQAYVYADKDTTDYDNLNWITDPISKSVLDNSVCAELQLDDDNLGSSQVVQYSYGNDKGYPLRTNSKSYKRMRTFQFEGTSVIGSPEKIRLTTWCDNNGTGSLRLFDVTNDETLFEIEVTNETESIITYSNPVEWPIGLSLVEIQMKRTSKKSRNINLSGMAVVY